jgi:hypothetical protein
MCFKIYSKCVSKEMDLRGILSTFFLVVKEVSDAYFAEIADVDFLKAEAINTISKICRLNSEDVMYFDEV